MVSTEMEMQTEKLLADEVWEMRDIPDNVCKRFKVCSENSDLRDLLIVMAMIKASLSLLI